MDPTWWQHHAVGCYYLRKNWKLEGDTERKSAKAAQKMTLMIFTILHQFSTKLVLVTL